MSEKMGSDVSETMTQLQWTELIPAAACLLIGLLAWSTGHRMLRPALVGAGMAVGAAAGWIAGAVLDLGLVAWVFAGIGAVGLGLAAWLAYRVVITIMMAALLAMVAAGATWISADLTRAVDSKPEVISADSPAAPAPQASGKSPEKPDTLAPQPSDLAPDPARGLPDGIGAFVRRATDKLNDAQAPGPAVEPPTTFSPDDLSDSDMHDQIMHMSGRLRDSAAKAESAWDAISPVARKAVLGAALLGAILGAALGLLAPKLSAIGATASIGALLVLGGGWVCLTKLEATDSVPLPSTAGSWVAVWLITSLAGMVIQWTFRRRGADKPA